VFYFSKLPRRYLKTISKYDCKGIYQHMTAAQRTC